MCRNRSGERVGRKAGAGWPRPAAWSEGYAMKAGRHSLAHRAQSLQIPDVWVSLGVGGEEIDLSLARSLAVSSPLFFRTRFFSDCHGGRGWLFVRPGYFISVLYDIYELVVKTVSSFLQKKKISTA